MKNFTPTEPAFTDTLSIYENTDPVDAESVDNVPLKQLIGNDLVLREAIPIFEYDEENRGLVITTGATLMHAGIGGTLPIATKTQLGGVKIGDNINVTEDGTISVSGTGGGSGSGSGSGSSTPESLDDAKVATQQEIDDALAEIGNL